MASPLTNAAFALLLAGLNAQQIDGTLDAADYAAALEPQLDRWATGGASVSRAAAVSTQAISGLNTLAEQTIDWFAGSADGGPDGDGLFPLTDTVGNTRMVPSPDKIATYAAQPDFVNALYTKQEQELVGAAPLRGLGFGLEYLTAGDFASPHLINILRDDWNAGGNEGQVVAGLLVTARMGGDNARGARELISALALIDQPSPSNPNPCQMAGGFRTFALVNEGGTDADLFSSRGAVWAHSDVAVLGPNATNYREVALTEGNVGIAFGGSAAIRGGYSAVGIGRVKGSVFDAGMWVGYLTPTGQPLLTSDELTGGFQFGFAVTDLHGIQPVSRYGAVLGSHGTFPVNRGIDFLSLDIFSEILVAPGVALSKSSFVMSQPNFGFETGSTTTPGATFWDGHTSGGASDYDVRIQMDGGDPGVGGLGNLSLMCQAVFAPQLVPHTPDLIFGAADRPWGTSFFSVEPTITSDERMKTPLEDVTDEELAAIAEIRIRRYKLLAAVDEKGESFARWHYGISAQEAARVYKKHKLDIYQSAFWIESELFDEVDEPYEVPVPVMETYDDVKTSVEVIDGVSTIVRTVTPRQRQKTADPQPLFNEDGTPAMSVGRRPMPMMKLRKDGTMATRHGRGIVDPNGADVPARQREHSPLLFTTETRFRKVRKLQMKNGKPVVVFSIRYSEFLALVAEDLRRRVSRGESEKAALVDRVNILEQRLDALAA